MIFPDADAVRGGASAPFGAGLGFGGEFDAELLMAGARAHNRWLAELCSDSPDRRCGLAIVPILHDIDDAVAEIRRARDVGPARRADPRAVAPVRPRTTTRGTTRSGRSARSSQMPVHTHTGPAPREEIGATTPASTRPRRSGGRRGRMWFLLWSGVFERHPDLKFAVTEGGCWWLADLLWKWDTAYTREHATEEDGQHRAASSRCCPSEYIDRNVQDRLVEHASS